MIVCWKNLHHAQELQKRAHNKGVKPRSYAPGKKVWLNSKYIKTKHNQKLEAKFFGPFRVLHPVRKQAYKLEIPKKWRIHDVFYVSLLQQDITRKRQVDDKNAAELDAGYKSGEYEVEAIRESAVYAKKADGHLSRLYYLVAWKGYPEEENSWETSSTVMHLRKMISTFYKDYSEKPTVSSPTLNTAPPMARLKVKLPAKKKQGQLKKCATKRAKWGDKEESESVWFSKGQKPAGSRRSVFLARGAPKSLQWQFNLAEN